MDRVCRQPSDFACFPKTKPEHYRADLSTDYLAVVAQREACLVDFIPRWCSRQSELILRWCRQYLRKSCGSGTVALIQHEHHRRLVASDVWKLFALPS
jgi:hypothetical protein